MKRLYFRVILGVLVVLVISFSLPTILFRLRSGNDPREQYRKTLMGTVASVRQHLEDVPPERLAKEVDSLSLLFGLPLRLADSAESQLMPPFPPLESTDSAGAPRREFSPGWNQEPRPNDIPPGERQSPSGPRSLIPSLVGAEKALFGDRNHPGPRPLYIPLHQQGRMLVVGPLPEIPFSDTGLLIALISIVLGVVGIAGFLIVAPVARNLRSLETAALQFGEGNLDSRAAVKSLDAVGSVATRFNKMADSIQQLFQRERQLLQSVSHELRTPIARIRFDLDLLMNAESQEERERRARDIDAEITEVDQLVGELLDYNRFHSESVSLDRQTFSARSVLEEVVGRLNDFRPEINIEITSDVATGCTTTADKLLFRRAVQNLVSNALRYAKTRVTLNCAREDVASVIEVIDDGPGIPTEHRDSVLKPFYRVDPSGSKESGGAGLGLAIVDRIIELHRGSISISDADGGGARFTTRWPDSPTLS